MDLAMAFLDEKVQEHPADLGAGRHEYFESPYGWNPIQLRNFNSKPLWTRKILTTEDTKQHEGKTKHAILIVVFGDWQTSLLIPAWGGKYFLCEPLCPLWLFLIFPFQCSRHLVVHIPFF